MDFRRVTVDPRQVGGVPCVRGLRIPVATLVAPVAEGQTIEEILRAYPDVEAEDIPCRCSIEACACPVTCATRAPVLSL